MPRDMADVVVVIPGILGSALAKNDTEVWGLSPATLLRGLFTLGGNVKALEMGGEDPALDHLGDGVVATRLLPDLALMGDLWRVDGYGALTKLIRREFTVDRGKNYVEFPYDWRRDNRAAARILERESGKWLSQWKQYSGNDRAQLILVAHSMGGLVSRYFLEVLGGWERTKALVTFGTPFSGSVNALNFLANGFGKKVGPWKIIDLSTMMRSFPSVYQLLPQYKCLDPGTGQPVALTQATLPAEVQPERVDQAAAFHLEIEEAVATNRRDPRWETSGYDLRPVVGIDQPTFQSARLEQGKVIPERSIGGKDLGGDGTVPRIGAVPRDPDGRKKETYSSEVHSSIQNSSPMLTHLEGVLSEDEIDMEVYFGPDAYRPHLGLDIDAAFDVDEPVAFAVHCAQPATLLEARITELGASIEAAKVAVTGEDAWRPVELNPLPEGAYRIEITGPETKEKLSEVFLVAGEKETPKLQDS